MKHIEFCVPTAKKVVPSRPDWFHEIKYDGYRLSVERAGDACDCSPRAATTGPAVFRGS
jgi:ATP-dependent DNA ligase